MASKNQIERYVDEEILDRAVHAKFLRFVSFLGIPSVTYIRWSCNINYIRGTRDATESRDDRWGGHKILTTRPSKKYTQKSLLEHKLS